MTNFYLKEKDLLEQHFDKIIDLINKYYEDKKRFILKDLIDLKKYNSFYINKTKGILETLIYFGYVEIVGLYNGERSFYFICRKKIKKN